VEATLYVPGAWQGNLVLTEDGRSAIWTIGSGLVPEGWGEKQGFGKGSLSGN